MSNERIHGGSSPHAEQGQRPTRNNGVGKRVYLKLTNGVKAIGYMGVSSRGWCELVPTQAEATIFIQTDVCPDSNDGATYAAPYGDDTYYLNHSRKRGSAVGLYPDSATWKETEGTGFVDKDDDTVLALDGTNLVVEPITGPKPDAGKALGVVIVAA